MPALRPQLVLARRTRRALSRVQGATPDSSEEKPSDLPKALTHTARASSPLRRLPQARHAFGMATSLTENRSHDRFAFGLTDASVEELRAILREECGEELSLEQAWVRAIRLVALFRSLAGMAPKQATDTKFELPPS